MTRLLCLFSLVNLVVGTGAFVVAGVFSVSFPAAGQAMTVHAFVHSVFGAVCAAVDQQNRRTLAMQLALIVFALGNVVCAFANTAGIETVNFQSIA